MYQFKKIKPTEKIWDEIESSYDSTCYQTRYWYNYISNIGYKPFVAAIEYDNTCVGYFLGEKVGWGQISLITAPLEGIGTYTQGLCMLVQIDNKERISIYKQLSKWIFDNSIASYMQVEDWQLKCDRAEWIEEKTWHHLELDEAQVPYEARATLYVSLNRPVDELWAGLHYKSAKYSVNKAKKIGLTVERITNKKDIEAFVKIHYSQLKEVCARKGTHPKKSQTAQRMSAICNALFPNRVFMLQVVGNDEDGNRQIMSTGIFCIDKGQCSYWTGASYARYQKYCPNELMVWEAMKMMSEAGAGDLNFCGMASYKLKFGTKYAYVPRMIFYKYRWLYRLKSLLKNLYGKLRLFRQNIKKKIMRK